MAEHKTTLTRPPIQAAARTLSAFLGLALVRADHAGGRLLVGPGHTTLTSWQGWPVEVPRD